VIEGVVLFFGRSYHFLAALLVFSALELWGKKVVFQRRHCQLERQSDGHDSFGTCPANKLRNFNKDQFVMIDGDGVTTAI